jgi:RNA polymerase sigma factor (sigma-70 family)
LNRSTYQNHSDAELLSLYARDNDPEWIGILLERYTLLLLGVCMKYLKDEQEARDSVQQIFLKVLTEAGKYKIEFFKSWLYMVAKNHCLMRLRDKGRKMKEVDEATLVQEAAQPHETAVDDLAHDHLEDALNELSAEQRQSVILFYLKKMSYQQVAEKTGFSLLQVKSYIQNGKRNLRIILERRLKQGKERGK